MSTPFGTLLSRRSAFQSDALIAPQDLNASSWQETAGIGQKGQTLADFRPPGVGDANLPACSLTSDFSARSEKSASTSDGTTSTIRSSVKFADFKPNDALDKFKLADTTMDCKYKPDGTTEITYTAKDFSTCKLRTISDGSCDLTISDRYARPTYNETVDAKNNSTTTKFNYDDSAGKPSFWAASKSFGYPDGTAETYTYDKIGRMISKTPTSLTATALG